MGHTREKYNAKARKSSTRPRKRARHHGDDDAVEDPNATIEKIGQRKEKLRQELLEQSESKFTSKKKKRLDKYIDKKLKKEERVQIFEKLQQSQADFPMSLHLQSSATLGSGRNLTNQDRLDRLEDKEVRRAMDGRTGGKGRKRRAVDYSMVDDGSGSDDSISDVGIQRRAGPMSMGAAKAGHSRSSPLIVLDEAELVEPRNIENPQLGSALKDKITGAPSILPISKRKRKEKRTVSIGGKKLSITRVIPEVPSDGSSFDSSDSAYDSPDADSDNDLESAAEDWNGFLNGNDLSKESGSEENSESEEPESDEEAGIFDKRKRTGFKEWALKQLSVAKGYIAAPDIAGLLELPGASSSGIPTVSSADVSAMVGTASASSHTTILKTPIAEMRGPLGEELSLPDNPLLAQLQNSNNSSNSSEKRSHIVHVVRPSEIQEARLALPILAEEQPIVEAIRLNPVVVICGETGSGKTTQVPQFLYEAGFGDPDGDNPGMIGITQPRRVAAMSMASRVSQELSLSSSRVSYQIRYDATVSPSTTIKFMTDGVLLRELATDFLVRKYSVIIIDEAHERSVNTDILVGVLSRVQKLRIDMWKAGENGVKPLRLVIMSATLRVEDFISNQNLFPSPPPVINVSARQYPVTIHFSRRTTSDYVSEAVKKAIKIHTRLPPGGILIFLTGQNEITGVCRKLEARFGQKAMEIRRKRQRDFVPLGNISQATPSDVTQPSQSVAATYADVEVEDMYLGDFHANDLALDVDGAPDDLDDEDLDSGNDSSAEVVDFINDDSDVPMHILPLYSLLPSERQMQVFKPAPDGTRLVIVATNVAETSLTIPGIRYVVDCGRAKERHYETSTGIQSFRVAWISKASAAQRAGRAGRTGPGHCYRLYSSALFEHQFSKFSEPEILRMPIEGVVLQMKSMHIDTVANFPFPTVPDQTSLRKAETLLTRLGALDLPVGMSLGNGLVSALTLIGGRITDLGTIMALFPLSPRFSKMLVGGCQHGCLPYVIATVSALSVGDLFVHEEHLELSEDSQSPEEAPREDLVYIHNDEVKAKEEHKLLRRAYMQSRQTHAQLGNAQSDVFSYLSVVGAYEYDGGGRLFCAEQFVRPKAMEEIHKLRYQISNIVQTNIPAAEPGFIPKLEPPNDLQLKVIRQLLCAAFIDQVAVRKDLVVPSSSRGTKYSTARGVAYQAFGIDEDVFIHPSSVLFNQIPPDFVVFQELMRSTRLWMKVLTIVNPAWLVYLGKKAMCSISKPTKNMQGDMMVTPRFGPAGWELPPMKADKLSL